MPNALLPDDPDTPEPADWYSERRARRLPTVLEEPLGSRHPCGRQSRPLPGQPPHSAGVRRGRGPQRDTQPRRDSLLGRLCDPGPEWLRLRRPRDRWGSCSRFVVRRRRRPERRPVRRRQRRQAAQQLLEHPRINATVTPDSEGGVEQSLLQGGINLEHRGDPAFDTADFAEPPGNLRADYVLPSKALRIVEAGVFWPTTDDPLFDLVGDVPVPQLRPPPGMGRRHRPGQRAGRGRPRPRSPGPPRAAVPAQPPACPTSRSAMSARCCAPSSETSETPR